jgi:hypothetical protein
MEACANNESWTHSQLASTNRPLLSVEQHRLACSHAAQLAHLSALVPQQRHHLLHVLLPQLVCDVAVEEGYQVNIKVPAQRCPLAKGACRQQAAGSRQRAAVGNRQCRQQAASSRPAVTLLLHHQHC